MQSLPNISVIKRSYFLVVFFSLLSVVLLKNALQISTPHSSVMSRIISKRVMSSTIDSGRLLTNLMTSTSRTRSLYLKVQSCYQKSLFLVQFLSKSVINDVYQKLYTLTFTLPDEIGQMLLPTWILFQLLAEFE